MFLITAGYSLSLIILGVIGYAQTDYNSPTSLIPAAIGLVFMIIAFLSLKDNLRKHVMHAGATLCLVSIIMTAKALPKMLLLAQGVEVELPKAVISKSIMCMLSVIYLIFCIRSFIAARKNRLANEQK